MFILLKRSLCILTHSRERDRLIEGSASFARKYLLEKVSIVFWRRVYSNFTRQGDSGVASSTIMDFSRASYLFLVVSVSRLSYHVHGIVCLKRKGL